MIRKWILLSLALLGSAILAPLAHASLIGTTLVTDGAPVAVPDETGNAALTGATIIAASELTEAIPASSTLKGTLYTAVIKEANGTLDFLYQVTLNSSSGTLHRLTGSIFAGYAVSAAYSKSNTFGFFKSTGTRAPNTADSSSDGTVGFNYLAPGLRKSTTSYIMIIGTDAKEFKAGKVALTNGQAANLDGWQPSGPTGLVPEPSTFAIASLGALGMIGYGLWRRKALGA
jgi:hypothetical protein